MGDEEGPVVLRRDGNISAHYFPEEERLAFVTVINEELKDDPHLQNMLPIDASHMEPLCKAVGPGILLWYVVFSS
jgi:hypothetical protein